MSELTKTKKRDLSWLFKRDLTSSYAMSASMWFILKLVGYFTPKSGVTLRQLHDCISWCIIERGIWFSLGSRIGAFNERELATVEEKLDHFLSMRYIRLDSSTAKYFIEPKGKKLVYGKERFIKKYLEIKDFSFLDLFELEAVSQ